MHRLITVIFRRSIKSLHPSDASICWLSLYWQDFVLYFKSGRETKPEKRGKKRPQSPPTEQRLRGRGLTGHTRSKRARWRSLEGYFLESQTDCSHNPWANEVDGARATLRAGTTSGGRTGQAWKTDTAASILCFCHVGIFSFTVSFHGGWQEGHWLTRGHES